jgi:hypothetical protein
LADALPNMAQSLNPPECDRRPSERQQSRFPEFIKFQSPIRGS